MTRLEIVGLIAVGGISCLCGCQTATDAGPGKESTMDPAMGASNIAESQQETEPAPMAQTTERRRDVRKGLDMDKYREMVEDVRSNPSHAQVVFRAEGASEDIVYHSTARVGPFEVAGHEYGQDREYILHLGVPIELQPEIVAPVDRIEPVELALGCLSDCVIGTIAVHAVINEIELDRITATVRAPVDLRVLIGLQDLEKRKEMYGQLEINVELEGPDLSEQDRAFLAQQAKRSPVFNLITLAHDAAPAVTIKPEPMAPAEER